jgi:hypothetical protein
MVLLPHAPAEVCHAPTSDNDITPNHLKHAVGQEFVLLQWYCCCAGHTRHGKGVGLLLRLA